MSEIATLPRAVVLLSGGLDSAVVLAIARRQGFLTHCLSFRYGQRHAIELGCAADVARALGATEHLVIDLPGLEGGSSLTGQGEVPRGRSDFTGGGIPSTYVPARNTVFLSLGLAWSERLLARDLWIGINHADSSGYPDCRPEFVAAFEGLANVGTREGVEGRGWRIHAPLLCMTKAEIVRKGISLGVDFGLTHSCYDPTQEGGPCGTCDSCRMRARGFEEVGVPDPRVQRFARP